MCDAGAGGITTNANWMPSATSMGSGISNSTMGTVGMGLQGAGAINSAMAAGDSTQAQKNAYNYQAAVASNNAKIAEWQAQDALRLSAHSAEGVSLNTGQLKSRQIAGMAANGIDLSVGSPLDILTSTDVMGQRDFNATIDSGKKQAWGFRNQATNYLSNAAADRSVANSLSPGYATFSSVLTGASNVASNWYKMKQLGLG